MIVIQNSSYFKIQDEIENSINMKTLDDYVQKFVGDIVEKMEKCLVIAKTNEQTWRNNTLSNYKRKIKS